MDYMTCCRENHLDCVENAMTTIKNHLSFFKRIAEEKCQELTLVQERNKKLVKAVEFLQGEQSAKKRRKTSGQHLSEKNANASTHSIGELDDSISAGQNSDLNLNVALHSDQLLNGSAISNTQDESIAETENQDYSRIRNNWAERRERSRLQCMNNENMKPDSWLGKPKKSPLKSFVYQPQVSKKLNNEHKGKLSFGCRKQEKTKQSTLQFGIKNKNDNAATTKEVNSDEVINESPNLYTTLKKAKHSRSLMPKTDGAYSNNYANKDNKKSLSAAQSTGLLDDNNDNHYFDFSTTSCEIPNAYKATNISTTPATLSGISDSSSVLMIPPATQDIIFIDDDDESASQKQYIGTMDLMAELLKNNDETLPILRRAESDVINQLQQRSNRKNQSERGRKTIPQPEMVIVKKEHITQPLDPIDNDATMLDENALRELESRNDEEDDEPFPLPILVKQETDIQTKQNVTKRKFDICCDDCENFLKFFGHNMSDKRIEEHLNKCKNKRERELLGHETPEDFWNPLMASFAADDPRREILTHTPFVGRGGKYKKAQKPND